LLPDSSEVALAAALASGRSGFTEALIVATIGNTLGSCVNWALGLYASSWRGSRFFPVKDKDFERYCVLYQKYGLWSLLASWVPIIGDPAHRDGGRVRHPAALVYSDCRFCQIRALRAYRRSFKPGVVISDAYACVHCPFAAPSLSTG